MQVNPRSKPTQISETKMASSFDCVVVGAGIQGSCTALHLARAGKRTLLIDQFEQGHTRGSSHGGSRIIRKAYQEPHYARLMPAAYEAWKALEEETGQKLITVTSLVNVSTHPPHDSLNSLKSTMHSLSLPYEILDGVALHARWPSLRYPDDAKALIDSTAGILKSDVALKTVQDLFVRLGGQVKWGSAVKQVVPGSPVVLKTDAETITGTSVVLCPGPWASSLLASVGLSLPLNAKITDVFYWSEKEPGSYSAPEHPVLIDLDSYDEHVFAVPAFEYPGLAKVCGRLSVKSGPASHQPYAGSPIWYDDTPAVNPDDDPIPDDTVPRRLGEYIKNYLPVLETTPSQTSTCFYTFTPDRNFILDKHPHHKNIIIGAGFSGTGFKLGPIVGHILSSLALNQVPPYDITAFNIGRLLQQQATTTV